MPYSDLHIKALKTAADCVSLGAGIRTVSMITGLAPYQIGKQFFAGSTSAPRGRPPDSIDWYHKTNLRNQAEGSAFASQYGWLRAHGFSPADSLLSGYRHYCEASTAPPRIPFDRGFDLVSQLEGRWAARTASLALLTCRTCECDFLAAIGTASTEGCPFCKIVRRRNQRGVLHVAAPHAQMPALRAPIAIPESLRRLETARACVALGARLRTVSALTGIKPYQLSQLFFRGPRTTGCGRPPESPEWYRWANLTHQADGCVFASHYRRLTQRGFDSVAALMTAYRHYADVCGPRPHVSFDRAFDLASHLDGRWIASARTLAIDGCVTCGCEFITGIASAPAVECPFCKLTRRVRYDARLQASFTQRTLPASVFADVGLPDLAAT
jgi:flagellar transcriptional activator FlhC